MKAVSRARASFADGFPMTVFLSCLRDAVVICRTVITLLNEVGGAQTSCTASGPLTSGTGAVEG